MRQPTTICLLILTFLFTTILPGKAQYQWEYMSPMPTARQGATSCVLDGKVYIIGGVTDESWPEATSSVEVYDPDTDTWDTNYPDLPMAIVSATSAVIDGKIYVIGGHDPYLDVVSKAVFEYDPYTGAWTSKADLPFERTSASAIAVDNTLFFAGGMVEGVPSENDFLKYNQTLDSWEALSSMLNAKAAFRMESIGGKIYAMGGLGDLSVVFTSGVDVYDVETDTWLAIASMPGIKYGFGSGVYNGRIFVFGGLNGLVINPEPKTHASPDTWFYDPASDEWADLGLSLPKSLDGFATTTVEDESGNPSFYIFGGGNDDWTLSNDVLKLVLLSSSREITKSLAPVVLHSNFPNPFETVTTIQYELKQAAKVTIRVSNLTGEQIATVFNGFQSAEMHHVEWSAAGVPAGVYFYTLQTDSFVGTGRLLVQK